MCQCRQTMDQKVLTFSSKALWCSNRLFRALSTSTSDDTPDCAAACLFTTVILSDRSCRETRHSRCSSRSCRRQQNRLNEQCRHKYRLKSIKCTNGLFYIHEYYSSLLLTLIFLLLFLGYFRVLQQAPSSIERNPRIKN